MSAIERTGHKDKQTKDPTVETVDLLAERHLVLRRSGGLSGVPRTRSHLELGR